MLFSLSKAIYVLPQAKNKVNLNHSIYFSEFEKCFNFMKDEVIAAVKFHKHMDKLKKERETKQKETERVQEEYEREKAK